MYGQGVKFIKYFSRKDEGKKHLGIPRWHRER
jgi:hypothetical protein